MNLTNEQQKNLLKSLNNIGEILHVFSNQGKFFGIRELIRSNIKTSSSIELTFKKYNGETVSIVIDAIVDDRGKAKLEVGRSDL